jgi:hypothetical protein
MRPIYVTSLFSLMKTLGLEQKRIAARLKISDSSTSLWATGQRPVSRRHEHPFLDLVAEGIRDDQEQAGLNSARVHHITAFLDAWVDEMDRREATCRRALQRQLELLNHPHAREDPCGLPPAERQRLRTAARMVVYYLDCLDSHGTPLSREGPAPKADPATEFERIRRSYREAPTSGEEGSCGEHSVGQ